MNVISLMPSEIQVEKIRLLLSTYQDGTGQLTLKNQDGTLPNWRDFERSTALAFNGIAYEAKAFFDVFVPISEEPETYFGISCKMRSELGSVVKKGIIYVEVSNASGDFWEAVRNAGIMSGSEMVLNASDAGKAILNLVESWHTIHPFATNIEKSYYLILQYNTKTLDYELFTLPLGMPDPESLEWMVRVGKKSKGGATHCLIGSDGHRAIIEWYADSGGQLKYYPSIDKAIWRSGVFKLQSLPDLKEGYSILNKVKAYFPTFWEKVSD